MADAGVGEGGEGGGDDVVVLDAELKVIVGAEGERLGVAGAGVLVLKTPSTVEGAADSGRSILDVVNLLMPGVVGAGRITSICKSGEK